METQIWLDDEKVEVMCVGHVTYEKSGYYARMGNLDNFKVFFNHENITARLSVKQLAELRTQYLRYCASEKEGA